MNLEYKFENRIKSFNQFMGHKNMLINNVNLYQNIIPRYYFKIFSNKIIFISIISMGKISSLSGKNQNQKNPTSDPRKEYLWVFLFIFVFEKIGNGEVS